MTGKRFDKLVEAAQGRERATLCNKGAEYTRGGDRLSNFKLSGARQECTPERALEGMNEKHLTSIHDMIKDLERGVVHPIEVWREKLGDARGYFLLLEGLVIDRIDGAEG